MNGSSIEVFVRQLVREAVRDAVRAELAQPDAPALRNAGDVYLSVSKAARVADVAPGTIRAWIRSGRLESRRAGRVLRVSRAELERFMAGMPNDAQQKATRRLADRFLHRARHTVG